jgi:hypothetical protein
MAKYLGIAALAALITAGVVFFVMRGHDGRSDVIVTVEGIKEIAQLSTVEYVVSDVLHKEKGKKWYEWKKASFLAKAAGKIKGGVDLEKMQIKVSNDLDHKRVDLLFERGAILISNPEIGPEDITIIDCSDPNIFHKISADDRNKAINEVISRLKSVAEDQGIRERTASEAKLVLTRFLQQLGFEVHIEFADEKMQAATAAVL